MSAESNLAGLYPPKGSQIWKKDIPWQPIPVHTVPLEADNLLSSHSNCPRMIELVEEVLKSPEVKKINEVNTRLPAVTDMPGYAASRSWPSSIS